MVELVPLAELEGVEVAVTQGDAQSDRLAGQFANIGRSSPADDPIEFVAKSLVGVLKSKAVDGLAAGRLDFDLNRSCGGSGKVQGELFAFEGEWPSEQLAAGQG